MFVSLSVGRLKDTSHMSCLISQIFRIPENLTKHQREYVRQ